MTFQTFTGKEYLKIDIASNFGLDKKTWDERIAWFDENESQLFDIVNQAEEPALFYAGAKAWEKAKAGLPTGYMISLDATSSGLQLLAVLTGDSKAASICNVIDTGDRADAYTIVYEYMLSQINDSSKIVRDDTKRAIMTGFYGSTAVPKEVFGEGELLRVFHQSMIELAPGAWELNEAFLDMWNPDAYSNDWVLPDNFHVHVKVMDTVKETVHFLNEPFDVFYKVNEPMEAGRSLGANTTHSLDGMVVREMSRRCDYNPKTVAALVECMTSIENGTLEAFQNTVTEDDNMVLTLWNHYKSSGYLSARIIDHLKVDNIGHVERDVIWDLLNSLPEKPFKVVAIHDCFRCLPNYGNELRIQYNNILRLIAGSNMLSYLLSQIVGRQVNIGKLDPNLEYMIIQANYALS